MAGTANTPTLPYTTFTFPTLTIVLSILGSLATGGIASNAEDLQDYIHPLAWRFCCRKSNSQPHQENYKMKEEVNFMNPPGSAWTRNIEEKICSTF